MIEQNNKRTNMASMTEFEVIKEIPGYKIILKAVLKSQIQQLVEQLAAQTEEESVILTASITDGSLSHLGSDSGRSFLEDNEDIKSNFLGFCLKKHHRKTQEAEREEIMRRATEQTVSPLMTSSRSLRHVSPRFSGSRGQSFASSGMRHQPYPMSRPIRVGLNPTSVSPLKPPNKMDDVIIKIEPGNEDEASNQSSSQPTSPSQIPPSSSASSQVKDEPNQTDAAHIESSSFSSLSTIPNETLSEPVCASSNSISSPSIRDNSTGLQQEVTGDTNLDSSVEVEAVTESEMDLEITGVELGRPVGSQGSWTPNVSLGLNFNPPGALNLDFLATAGNQTDMHASQQGYNNSCQRDNTGDSFESASNVQSVPQQPYYVQMQQMDGRYFVCTFSDCRRVLPTKQAMQRHTFKHTGEKPYKCSFCHYHTSRKDSLRVHMLKLHSLS